MDMRSYTKSLGQFARELPETLPEVKDESVARGLGWVSIAIGLSEICCPRQIENAMGIGNHQNTGILRVLGVRELCHGVDILSHRDPTPGIWSRVFGDLLDGVLLAMAGTKTRRPGGFATICALVLPVVVLDMIYARRCSADRDRCES